MTSLPLFLTDKPAIAPPVFVFQKDKAQKVRFFMLDVLMSYFILCDFCFVWNNAHRWTSTYRWTTCDRRSAEGSSAEDGEDSDKDEGSYCPPVKRERTSSFPPPHSEEKPVGFRLKPPTLIHGQAPSSGVPSQKPKEQQRSVLRPAVLQAPPSKSHIESSEYILHFDCIKQENEKSVALSFVFGQNIKDRAKLDNSSTEENSKDSLLPDCQSESTNYFLQYISTPSSKNASNSGESGAKFVFGQNMSERVLSPPKGEASSEESKDVCAAPASESPSQETSLEESAAAYTKATAKKCVLEKVDVKTGEESESNVLQMQCKLYVFEKKAQSWIERGRGLLRLNDMASTEDGALQSRLVMRTQGSLRLILNTKLWPQMQVDKASEKSVRITAMDTEDQGVKVFLISGSSKDIGQLAAALHHRILALKSKAEQETEALTTTIPDAEVPQSNEDDSDEEDKASPAASAAAAGQGSVLHHLHLFGLSF
uniref:Ran-binding protein 3 n=1 Tax=Oryzias sinensis TaxID=183150 RepID=A0A8C8DYK0_9TELE